MKTPWKNWKSPQKVRQPKKWRWPQKNKDIPKWRGPQKGRQPQKKRLSEKWKWPKKKDDLHIAEMHMALDVFSFAVFLIVTNIYFRYGIV